MSKFYSFEKNLFETFKDSAGLYTILGKKARTSSKYPRKV